MLCEYLTGGGYNQQVIPAALLSEASLMLTALLADCLRLPDLSINVMLDKRCEPLVNGVKVTRHIVPTAMSFNRYFQALLLEVDAVWLIAPEFDGILHTLAALVEASPARLLSSSAAAVALTADKWRTYQCLQAAAIPTVSTQLLAVHTQFQPGTWVIKPRDGVGCESTWFIEDAIEFETLLTTLPEPSGYIQQPYCVGLPASLSCLFAAGQGWVICANAQQIQIDERQFSLTACQVNHLPVSAAHRRLAAQIAQAVPGLLGYVGIDFIENITATDEESQLVVLEINPRLTSSYVGIYAALGINVVEWVLKLPEPPHLVATRHESIRVALV